MNTITAAQMWLDSQPDLIVCPGYGTRMTIRSCHLRLKSPYHYQQKVSSMHDPEDETEVNISFHGCLASKCPHYKPTTKRARCYRGSGGNNNQNTLSQRLNDKTFNAAPRK